jgi:hypothetical protein
MKTAFIAFWIVVTFVGVVWPLIAMMLDHCKHKRRMRELACNNSLLAKARWEMNHGNRAEAERLLADFDSRMNLLWKEAAK